MRLFGLLQGDLVDCTGTEGVGQRCTAALKVPPHAHVARVRTIALPRLCGKNSFRCALVSLRATRLPAWPDCSHWREPVSLGHNLFPVSALLNMRETQRRLPHCVRRRTTTIDTPGHEAPWGVQPILRVKTRHAIKVAGGAGRTGYTSGKRRWG